MLWLQSYCKALALPLSMLTWRLFSSPLPQTCWIIFVQAPEKPIAPILMITLLPHPHYASMTAHHRVKANKVLAPQWNTSVNFHEISTYPISPISAYRGSLTLFPHQKCYIRLLQFCWTIMKEIEALLSLQNYSEFFTISISFGSFSQTKPGIKLTQWNCWHYRQLNTTKSWHPIHH